MICRAGENGCAEHTFIPPKSSRAVKWNERSLQMTKYFDSLGNVKFHFDISEAFLWNWTLPWIIWKRGFFILILGANKHWSIWIIHAVETDFGQHCSVISLGTEWILTIHQLPVICQIFFLSHFYLEYGKIIDFFTPDLLWPCVTLTT